MSTKEEISVTEALAVLRERLWEALKVTAASNTASASSSGSRIADDEEGSYEINIEISAKYNRPVSGGTRCPPPTPDLSARREAAVPETSQTDARDSEKKTDQFSEENVTYNLHEEAEPLVQIAHDPPGRTDDQRFEKAVATLLDESKGDDEKEPKGRVAELERVASKY